MSKPPPPPPGKGPKGAPPPKPGGKAPPGSPPKGPPGKGPPNKGPQKGPPGGKGGKPGPPGSKGPPPGPPGTPGKGPPPGTPGPPGKGGKGPPGKGGKGGKPPPPGKGKAPASPAPKGRPPPPSPKPSGPPSRPATPPATPPPSNPPSRGSSRPGTPKTGASVPPSDLPLAPSMESMLAAKLDEVQKQMAELKNDMEELKENSPRKDSLSGTQSQFDLSQTQAQLPLSVIEIVERVFNEVDRKRAGRVNKADFRAALLNEPDLLGAPTGQLVNKPALNDVLGCERLVRMLDINNGPPFEVDWSFVRGAFTKQSCETDFETQLKKVFQSLDVTQVGAVRVSNLVRIMDELHCQDPVWEAMSDVLRGSPPKWEVSWNELSAMLASTRSSPCRHGSVRKENFAYPQGRLDSGIESLLNNLNTERGSPRRRYTSVPPSSPPLQLPTMFGNRDTGDSAVVPSMTKRQLRIEAVSDRVSALKEAAVLGGNSRTQRSKTLTNRLTEVEQRLAKLVMSNVRSEKMTLLEDEVVKFEAMLDEEARHVQRNSRQMFSTMTQLREAVRSGVVRREIMETVAPRVYKFLLQSADGLAGELEAEVPVIARAKESLGTDKIAATVKAKSDELDQIIHTHGLGEEKLAYEMKREIELLNVGIEEERAKRKHMETVFVSLMESIISRLYEEINDIFNERKVMDERLHTRLEVALHSINTNSIL